MKLSRRLINIWALICIMAGAQIIHAGHFHDAEGYGYDYYHESKGSGSAVFDCSICSFDHFNDSTAPPSGFDAHSFDKIATSFCDHPCVVTRPPFFLSYARAPPLL